MNRENYVGVFHSVRDFGAVGDGLADDTDAIQAGINHVYAKGGGTLFFPYAARGYRIAKPAREEVDGKPCRSQLYIPSEENGTGIEWRNICLVGEMPVCQLHMYQMVMGGNWRLHVDFPLEINNVCLISDWDAPEETDRDARPWSMLSVLGGHKLPFGLGNLTIRDLEFRVHLNTEKMYPTSSAGNFMSTSRLILDHCYFGLDKNIGSVGADKELIANPCYTAGVIASRDQCDHQLLTTVGVQGFRYGFVLGERVCANYLHVHNCEEGIVFHDSSHFSLLNYVAASANRVVISALREPTFNGLFPSRDIYFRVNALDCEQSQEGRPIICRTQTVVHDPDDRLTADIIYHSGWPPAADNFSMVGGKRVRVSRFGDWVENNNVRSGK